MTDISRVRAAVADGRREPGQLVASAVAVVFLLVGTVSIVPGSTEGVGRPGALLFGVLAHLVFGVVGSRMARTPGGARVFLVGGGVLYFLLQLFAAGGAAHWLHLALATSMIGLALFVGNAPTTQDSRATEPRELTVPVVEPAVQVRRSARNRPPGRGSAHARVAAIPATRLAKPRRNRSSRSCAPRWPVAANVG